AVALAELGLEALGVAEHEVEHARARGGPRARAARDEDVEDGLRVDELEGGTALVPGDAARVRARRAVTVGVDRREPDLQRGRVHDGGDALIDGNAVPGVLERAHGYLFAAEKSAREQPVPRDHIREHPERRLVDVTEHGDLALDRGEGLEERRELPGVAGAGR